MSEKGYEADIERRRFNVADVPTADIRIAMTAMIGADFGPRLLQIAKVV